MISDVPKQCKGLNRILIKNFIYKGMAASGKTPPQSDKDKKALKDALNDPNKTDEEKEKIGG